MLKRISLFLLDKIGALTSYLRLMKNALHNFSSIIVLGFLLLFNSMVIAQTASDQASNYSGTWANASNQGTGFGAWTLTAGANTGFFIGNPSSNGMSTSLLGTTAFGLYANGNAYASATRNITTPMAIGDALSFHWSVNWDANTGSKGIDFKAAGTTVFNVNMGGSSTITAGGINAQTAYGTNNMIVTMSRISATQYTFSLTARDGVSAIYTATVNISSAIDNINFYIGNQNDFAAPNNGNRNMYFNNLMVSKIQHRSNVAAGSWSTLGSWQQSADNGTSWYTATIAPSNTFGATQILNGHNITATAATIDQFTIQAGGTLTVPSGVTFVIANGADAIDCSVLGIIANAGTITPTGNITVGNGGKYTHTWTNGGAIPTSTWATGATCEVTGFVSGTTPTNLTQNYHHLTWNCAAQTGAANFAGAVGTVNGNFNVKNTGTSELRLTGATNLALSVAGDFVLDGNSTGGNCNVDMCTGAAASAFVFLKGSLIISAGRLACTNVSNQRFVYFESNLGNTQDINITTPIVAFPHAFDFGNITSNGSRVRLLSNVNSTGGLECSAGSILDFQNYVWSGTQATGKTFYAWSGAHLISANTNATGAFTTSGANGSIQLTGTRTYNGVHFTFNGTAPQKTGNGVTTIGNLTINNVGSTVALTNNISMSGILNLINGKVLLGNFNLTLTNNSPSAVVGGSSTAHIVTGDPFLYGTLGKLFRNIAGTGFPAAYVFPVGNDTGYMPMTLTFTANSVSRNVSVYAMNGTQSSVSSSPSYLSNRYWITDLSSTTGTYNFSAKFEFPAADVVGGFSSLQLYKSSTSFTDTGSSATATSVTSSALTNVTAALSGSATWTAKGTTSGSTAQTITFNTLSAVTYGDANFNLTATASSGLAVTYTSSNTAVATVSGSAVTIVGAGSTTITASQVGDASYSAATPVTQTLVVNPKTLTVTGAIAQNKVYDGNNTATITGATLNGVVGSDVVNLTSAGTFNSVNVGSGIAITPTFSISGAQAGNYTLTQPAGLSADITQATQTISFGALTAVNFGGANFNLTATASSGLTVTYTSSNPAVATVSGNTVTIVGVGTTTITASQAGNASVAPATDVTQTLAVNQATQTISFAALPNKLLTDVPFALTATASSGLTVSYTSSNTAVATVSGNTVTIVGLGSTIITASQSGNANYAAATSVNQTQVVSAPGLVWFNTSALPGGVNNFGPSPLFASYAANVTSTGLIRGPGVSTTATAAARAWGGVNWSQSVTADLASNAFFTFDATVAAGYEMDLLELSPIAYRRSASGPAQALLQYSIDGGTTYSTITTLSFTNTGSTGAVLSPVDLSAVTALQNLHNCTTVKFKILPFGATAAGGTLYIFDVNNSNAADLSLNGVITSLATSPVISIASSDADNVICSGTSVTFTATASASTSLSYQWKKDGVSIVGETNSTYVTSGLTSGSIVCEVNACGQTLVSSSIYTTVIGTPTLSLSTSSGVDVCSGTTPTFTASGATSYQYFLNGVAQSSPSSTASFTPATGLNSGDQVCVRGYNALPFSIDGDLTDGYWGAALANSNGGPASSGFGANRLDALYLRNGLGYLFGGIAGSLENSSGNKVLLFIDCNSGGYNSLSSWIYRSEAPYYSMKNLNGGIQFDNGFEPDYIMGINIASDVLYFDLYNMQTNSNTYLGASNTGTLYAYQSNTATGDYTKGFEFSIPMNLLGTPSGSMKVMAMLVNDPGIGNATFLSNQFLSRANNGEGNYGDGGVNFGVAAPNPVSYDVIQDCYSEQCVTTTQSITPAVSIVSDDVDNTICQDDLVTFNATPVNGGSGASYQWKVNGNNVGSNASQFSSSSLSNADVVSVVMTANNTCQTQSTATSNTIATTVNTVFNPSISIASDLTGNVICAASNPTVVFTATSIDGGSSPVYQWKKNGTNVGTNSVTYSATGLAGGDQITCVMTPNNICQSAATASSNTITLTSASLTTTYLDADGDGFGNVNADSASCSTPFGYVTSSTDCNDASNAVYPGATEVCNTIDDDCDGSIDEGLQVTPTVAIVSDDLDATICSGTSVTFTAAPTNGGSSPAYQWKLNGNNVGTNVATYSSSSLLNGDIVEVVMTANNLCQTSATAISNTISFVVNANVVPTVNITSNLTGNTLCGSATVIFTASSSNEGVSPSYQWKLNGNNVGTNSASYTLVAAVANDQVSVVLSTTHTCQASPTTNSNTITLTASASNSYYLDADNDGFGNASSLVTDCSAPVGYIATAGDCNDSDSGINPDALEICNSIDDNCNGQTEEGVIFINLYLDNDGDGYGATSGAISACDLVAGYITTGGDCNDNNVNIQPGATEVCSNSIDDDCDGLVNEVCLPGNDEPQYAANAIPAINLTACNTYTGTLSACTPSPAMSGTWTSGPDVWYYFTANGPGVTIRCTPTSNDVALDLRTFSGDLLKTSNAAAGVSDEYLNYGNLNVGQQYYLRVRNVNAAQAGGAFSLCLRRLTAAGNLNYTNSILYDTGCDMVYAANTTGSNGCTIQLTPISPSGGAAITATGPTAMLANFTGTNGEKVQYNTVYSATIALNYTLPTGGGGTENISVSRVTDNQLNVVSHVDLNLGSVHVCPNRVVIGGLIRANIWMCDAVKYQWRFERMFNGSPYLVNGNPVVIETYGVNGTRDLYLYGNLGFTSGTEWRVQVRPVFANNVVGQYYTNYQCMIFKGTLAAVPTVENEEEMINEKALVQEFSIPTLYPNPSRTGYFRVDWLSEEGADTQVEIWDAMGRKVGAWTFSDVSTMEMDGANWESGVYQVRISRGKESHLLRWMKN